LTIESAHESFSLPSVAATDDPAAVGPVDLILFAVKLWDTETAARALAPMLGPETAVVSFQNGVRKDDMIRPFVGEHALMGGIAQVSAVTPGPGSSRRPVRCSASSLANLTAAVRRAPKPFSPIAATPASTPRSAPISSGRFGRNSFSSSEYPRSRPPCARRSARSATIRSRAFLRDLMAEVVAVGRAHGVDLPDDYADDRLAFIDTLPPQTRASMAHDLAAGNRLELPWLSGGVVDLGQAVGAPTPLNRAVRDIVGLYSDGAGAGQTLIPDGGNR
jgi:2-dehydropantoate 2-reductase